MEVGHALRCLTVVLLSYWDLQLNFQVPLRLIYLFFILSAKDKLQHVTRKSRSYCCDMDLEYLLAFGIS